MEVAAEFPNTVFFAGQLVFSEEFDSFINRLLHNHTALEVLRWLQLRGLSLVILPVRVALFPRTAANAPHDSSSAAAS